ncbi:DHH family phosphoesterase [Halapricum hydrolyticum]|uniref:OB-fold nucleic acid binding domain-containing protein n=1 Tax=Halapricum hydrolyticum TaxID=2979991 RepID=A0AAE3IB65_9EURY|nr:OB-fold nucleic acid binding domain-containing protein [Halapricum hydrolyticum]MCU4719128.1 OB-fold nucleic acid binding domain-containing protein [Halapricum hydrolyticum]MCU4727318.1 OB-fold nucleic acid binding domain-containing protein [Halapricum hydrolyticum]
MGSCIICGKSVDGKICDIHQEDVAFEFRGSSPDQLTPGRYYKGTVDGFAEFGVFVDIDDSVTGLLHESELDSRLDNLEWEPGDTVYVQVKNVRDNGNVDLGWSIRQSDREFRGKLIDDPEFDEPKLPDEVEADKKETPDASDATAESGSSADSKAASESDSVSGSERSDRPEAGSVRARQAESPGPEAGETRAAATEDEKAVPSEGTTAIEEAPLVTVDSLDDRIGEMVQLEGRIESARQTSGPTVFELTDGTGTVDCAAFEEAGVRAYPDVGEDDVVRLTGEVRERRGELQVETEQLVTLADDEREGVRERMEEALTAKARPDAVELLAEDETLSDLSEAFRDAAGEIRRAVFEERPIVVRHSATADGYVAGAAIERATLPLIREEHTRSDAEYHYFDRRPLEGDVYEMGDATKDVTTMLDNRERHDEQLPLYVFVAVGGTRESLDSLQFLDVYDAPRLVIDTVAEPEITDEVETVVSPDTDPATLTTVDGQLDGPTTAAIAANVAAHVNDDVREDLLHLPAVSFWEVPPRVYADAAAEAGYEEDAIADIRDAVALEAYYQSYEDKRQLIADLLFEGRASDVADDEARGLASHVSEQFRSKLDTAVETARANVDHRTVDGVDVAVFDTEAFTHRFDFPPETLLLDELLRQLREDVDAIVGIGDDDLHLRSEHALDVREVATQVAEAVPDAGVEAESSRSQQLAFLAGRRADVLEATLETVADQLA